jgi:hypothetical protein
MQVLKTKALMSANVSVRAEREAAGGGGGGVSGGLAHTTRKFLAGYALAVKCKARAEARRDVQQICCIARGGRVSGMHNSHICVSNRTGRQRPIPDLSTSEPHHSQNR